MTPREELAALGAFYGVSVDAVAATCGDALDRYAEWVLGRDDFALVTLGDVPALCRLARAPASTRLARAAARWPAAITGIKLELGGQREPTLYIRTTCPWHEAVDWLGGEVDAAIVERIPQARAAYGLGFQGDVIKTYALTADGFVSYRVDAHGVHDEHKDYRAEVPWAEIAWPDARWQAIGALGRSLAFRTAGHVGVLSSAHELKVYVERIGAIATDRSLA
jgi:hypothetical protein